MKKLTTAPAPSLHSQPRWTPALRFMLVIAQVISVIGVSTISLTQPKFAPLVGDTLGPWVAPLARTAAEAVDAAIGQPNVAAAATGTCPIGTPFDSIAGAVSSAGSVGGFLSTSAVGLPNATFATLTAAGDELILTFAGLVSGGSLISLTVRRAVAGTVPTLTVDSDTDGIGVNWGSATNFASLGTVASVVTYVVPARGVNRIRLRRTGGTANIDVDAAVQAERCTTVNLAISKTDAPDPVLAGQLLTYTLLITNTGPDAIVPGRAFTVTDTFPGQFTPVNIGCN